MGHATSGSGIAAGFSIWPLQHKIYYGGVAPVVNDTTVTHSNLIVRYK